MLVAGANRHAKEILELLYQQQRLDDLQFFDDINVNGPTHFFDRFTIIHQINDLPEVFRKDNRFILGLGGTKARAIVAKKIIQVGGRLHAIISETSRIGHFQVELGVGVNIMEFVLVSNSVRIGDGCLINAYAAIHHDVTIGIYCEISPRATLLGGVSVGDYVSVGSGAIILPNVRVGSNVIIGAGCVVNKDVPDNSLVVGVPGKVIRELPPFKL